MAYTTEYLYILGVSSFRRVRRMRFDMMPLKIRNGGADFAAPAFCNNVVDYSAGCMRSFAFSAFPVRVIRTRSSYSMPHMTARIRAVISSTSPSFTSGKYPTACFAGVRDSSLRAIRPYLPRTLLGASISFPSIMTAEDRKLFGANRANESYFASAFNFSRSI